jgi:hypothetical protein
MRGRMSLQDQSMADSCKQRDAEKATHQNHLLPKTCSVLLSSRQNQDAYLIRSGCFHNMSERDPVEGSSLLQDGTTGSRNSINTPEIARRSVSR